MAQMKYFYELTISSSPHVHAPYSTRTIMRDVVIALLPALLGSVYFFGFRALLVTLVSVAACVFFEWGYCKLTGMNCKVYDLSAVVTGMLIAFVCPVTIPYWTIIIGDFFAIIVVKMLFGGIGRNIVNPALGGRAFMMSWALLMSTWIKVGFQNAAPILGDTSLEALDGMTAATPMSFMHQDLLPNVSVMDAFWGNVGGCIGETSALLLLVGLVYLLIRKVITLRIPLSFIGTVAVLTFLFPQGGNDRFAWMGYQVFCGGLMLGAIFMATDYVTSPLTRLGQIVYGIGCGVITVVIRYFGGYPEGVSYAILVMNCCVVLFDRIGRPKKFGAPKKVKEAKKA
jgi:electron transport complex protein RnfD